MRPYLLAGAVLGSPPPALTAGVGGLEFLYPDGPPLEAEGKPWREGCGGRAVDFLGRRPPHLFCEGHTAAAYLSRTKPRKGLLALLENQETQPSPGLTGPRVLATAPFHPLQLWTAPRDDRRLRSAMTQISSHSAVSGCQCQCHCHHVNLPPHLLHELSLICCEQ